MKEKASGNHEGVIVKGRLGRPPGRTHRRVHLSLSNEQATRLRIASEQEGRTQSEIMRRALALYLDTVP